MKEIIIEISMGVATIEVNGVKGKACTEITKKLKKAMGGKTVSEKVKPEYYQAETSATRRAGL